MDKKSFVLHYDSLSILDKLSDEQCGKLLRKMKSYHNGNTYEPNDMVVEIAFEQFRNQFDRDKEKSRTGEYHRNWKGGKSSENHRERNSVKYKEWRNNVFKRDGYKCLHCGKVGGILNTHHIELFSININKRFDIDNGITLCKQCHILVHNKNKNAKR